MKIHMDPCRHYMTDMECLEYGILPWVRERFVGSSLIARLGGPRHGWFRSRWEFRSPHKLEVASSKNPGDQVTKPRHDSWDCHTTADQATRPGVVVPGGVCLGRQSYGSPMECMGKVFQGLLLPMPPKFRVLPLWEIWSGRVHTFSEGFVLREPYDG